MPTKMEPAPKAKLSQPAMYARITILVTWVIIKPVPPSPILMPWLRVGVIHPTPASTPPYLVLPSSLLQQHPPLATVRKNWPLGDIANFVQPSQRVIAMSSTSVRPTNHLLPLAIVTPARTALLGTPKLRERVQLGLVPQ